ncbi:DNA-binding transcriptional regulator YhcF (GntR family) [Psychromicrobium silvestre]|uniref:DNA-binding transcriptional regulator YhcF (GntR family) n=1 Tax=Psychromicrobium silvestre TaxID=1645614 RepID=A0A7Y9LTK6_9MICC|nr:GntR family transcriptional regulator [Psychromicrobium silvestre]NYE95327.1 DNA-binding transcriptional regulator YhcF (GntR family) [Psychromicrobium silvestre]
MTVGLRIELNSPTPPYEQIRTQIASLIAVGSLRPGSQLPTVRSLASDLGVAIGTVGRAYKELEAQGLIESRRRSGTVVAVTAPERENGNIEQLAVLQALEQLIASSHAAGLSAEHVLGLVRGRLQSDQVGAILQTTKEPGR